MTEVRWVGQEHRSSCGAACLAMVTGKSYDEVCREIPERQWNNWLEGMSAETLDALLAGWGLAVARRYGTDQPFGQVHICAVHTGVLPHWVVMLADGVVLDPGDPQPTTLAVYACVLSIAAIVPLDAPIAAGWAY